MNCARSGELLHFYLDGSLEPDERHELETHVASCALCRSEMVQLERVMLAVESLPRLSAPASLITRTMDAVARPAGWERRRALLWAANAGGIAVMTAGFCLAATSAGDALVAVSLLTEAQESPLAVVDGLLAVAGSLEVPLVAGIGLMITAGCVTLGRLVTPGAAPRAS